MLAGNLVFHGPRGEVVPYFQNLGFYIPERKAVSDFLQEVTSKKDQKVLPLPLPGLMPDLYAKLGWRMTSMGKSCSKSKGKSGMVTKEGLVYRLYLSRTHGNLPQAPVYAPWQLCWHMCLTIKNMFTQA